MHGDFKDAVIDAWYRQSLNCFLSSSSTVSKIYNETVPSAKLRKFVIDQVEEKEKIDEDDFPPSFLKDFCNSLMVPRPLDWFERASAMCNYHEHGDRECYRGDIVFYPAVSASSTS